MKKTLIISFLSFILISGSVFAQTNTDLTASAQKPKEVSEVILTKKQKIELELRTTISKLDSVIVRTQNLIDLLTKNGKDVKDANELLISSKNSLLEATETLDQFSGIAKEVKKEITEEKPTLKAVATKEIVVIKDPLKKTQESLKLSKNFLIESIKNLKQGLLEENDGE